MEKHITLVGVLHIVYSGMAMVIAFLVFVLLTGTGLLVRLSESITGTMAGDAMGLITGLVFVILAGIVLLSIPGIVGGIGVLRGKEWGRILLLVVSFFDLFHVPLGTGLGIYSIWVLMSDEVVKRFSLPASPQP